VIREIQLNKKKRLTERSSNPFQIAQPAVVNENMKVINALIKQCLSLSAVSKLLLETVFVMKDLKSQVLGSQQDEVGLACRELLCGILDL
jgi:hypothetical protein